MEQKNWLPGYLSFAIPVTLIIESSFKQSCLFQSLEEISVENHQQQLETCRVDSSGVSEAIRKSKKKEKGETCTLEFWT